MNQKQNSRGIPLLLRMTLLCSLLFSTLLLSDLAIAAPPAPDSSGFDVIQLPPEALRAPDFGASPAATGSAKMESALNELASNSRTPTASVPELVASEGFRMSGERVQVLITTEASRADAAVEAITRAGGEVTGRGNGNTWLQAWVPVSSLEAVAADPTVDYVSRPGEPFTAAVTEGASVINAPAWNSAGLTGSGVKVAVIDAGFKGYPALLGNELPANTVVKNFVDGETDAQVNGSTEHGAACAEVVHDIAPNASIYLVKVGTNLDLEEAVNWAKTQGITIISTSLTWYNMTPGDGTGFFANLVQSARNAGIFWTTAGGNDREAHWGGAFNDTDSNSYHQFAGTQDVNFFGPGNGNAYTIPSGVAIRAFLRWDDWTAKNQDYDLYLVRWNGTAWQQVGKSETRQTGGAGQTPTESISYVTSGATAPYGFLIKRYSSNRNVNLEFYALKVARLDKIVPARSLGNLADAPAAMTVAALNVASPYAQESYSAEGPANGPGGTANGGSIKPDIAGFANVSTISYPDPAAKFNGTSAATPHVAGAAALVKGVRPGFTPAQIQSFLEGRAVDMGASGKDTLYGWGRLFLGAPLPKLQANSKNYLPFVTRAIDAPALNAINNPGNSSNYTVSWGSVPVATSYVLQEAVSADFTGATKVYAGSGLSWGAAGKAPGTYYYRVRSLAGAVGSAWSNVQSTAAGAAWNIILSDGFEGSFPGAWHLWKTSAYDWGKRSCRAASGSYSAWGVGGSALACGSYYPDNSESWMYYGPFSLANASAAEVRYKLWNNTESGADGLCVMASTDDVNYYGTCGSGNSNGWIDRSFDLSNVNQLGDLRGSSQVWVAFIFGTDDSINYPEGSHVDDVLLRKCVGGGCVSGAPTVQATGTEMVEMPVTMRRTR